MQEITRAGTHADGDIDLNTSTNPHMIDIIEAGAASRRTVMGGMAAVATLFGLSACDDDTNTTNSTAVVSAGAAVATTVGKLVTLVGTATGATQGVLWTQVSGPTVTLTNATTNTATFIAPAVAASTPLVFRFQGSGPNQILAQSDTTVTVGPAVLGFNAVAKNLNDIVTLPAGYTMSVLYALGDPLASGVSAYQNNGADTNFAQRAGDHHDGMYYFGLSATGGRDDSCNTRGILCVNHENVTEQYLHASGGVVTVAGARSIEADVRREIECHGVGIVEVLRGSTGGWSYVQGSTFNRRITPLTPMAINGPARGDALMRTKFSPTGVAGRGTVNNCANGYAPWGTYLTCEENWAGYFNRAAGDNALRPVREGQGFARYGVAGGPVAGLNWGTTLTATPNDDYLKWDASVKAGQPATGAGDYRYEPNQFGWIVEIDPYDPASTPRKRTAMGRMAHEGAWPANFVAGQRPVYYMGDDSRGEYFYKFVSATPWDPADAARTDRLNVGDKYLDAGTLYVARFDANGTGVWLPLTFGSVPAATNVTPNYVFASQADVLIHTRLAADALGATRMDRPEWAGVNPTNGEVYLTLTNNNATGRPLTGTDAANPRHFNDPRTTGAAQRGNPNGHIIRLRESAAINGTVDPTRLTFFWDIYVFGAGSDLDATNINVSGLAADNDFASPDGLWFSRPSNPGGQVNPLLWIQTDDGSFTDQTNNQMLLALPGVVGDGGPRTITNTDATGATRQQATRVGRAQTNLILKRFLTGPRGCEITGIDSTPDGRTIFVNIQHPGEGGSFGTPTSNWPQSQATGTGTGRPRSATIVITKTDGGVVGL